MKQYNNLTIKQSVLKVLKYFSFFAYNPTSEEIYTFLQAKINRNSFNIELECMVKQKLIVNCKLKIENSNQYTPPQYSIQLRNVKLLNGYMVGKQKNNNLTIEQFNNLNKRKRVSQSKLNSPRFKFYVKLLAFFPQIKLVGLSGSISMMNAGENDDIDLFIITAKNRLFTGRLIALFLAQLLGLRRSRDSEKIAFSSFHKDKVCLNLFFDESNLKVPIFKQTEFVGHEVLQMKPIIIKGNIYKKFLEANEWVFKIFPNGKSKSQIINLKSQINYKRLKFKILNLFGTWNLGFVISNKIESFLKNLQLSLINRHRTTEIITSTQLWFHPNDFEKKVKH